MKKDGKYRFSLQFGADSEERVRVGELLERLGNSKSTVVVAALNEYMDSHPELQAKGCKIEVRLTPGYNRDGMEELIRAIVDEKLSALQPAETGGKLMEEESAQLLEEDIAQMLDNLDMFS